MYHGKEPYGTYLQSIAGLGNGAFDFLLFLVMHLR